MDEEDGGGRVMLAVRCAALRGLGLYYNAGDDDDDRNAPRTRHIRIFFCVSFLGRLA
jgi:hypothetical protein